MCVCSVTQLCPTLCNPMDCSPPGFSVHGILQARILEWVAMPSSRGYCRWILHQLSYQGSTSCDMLVWMNHKLETRLLGEISTISEMQMIPL